MNKTRRKNIDKTVRLLNQTFESGTEAFGGRTQETELRNGDVVLTRILRNTLFADMPTIFRIRMIFTKTKTVSTLIEVKKHLHTFAGVTEIIEYSADRHDVKDRISQIQLYINYEATRLCQKRASKHKPISLEEIADVFDKDLEINRQVTSSTPTQVYMRPVRLVTKTFTLKGPGGVVRTYRIEYREDDIRETQVSLKFYTIKRTYSTVAQLVIDKNTQMPPIQLMEWVRMQTKHHEAEIK